MRYVHGRQFQCMEPRGLYANMDNGCKDHMPMPGSGLFWWFIGSKLGSFGYLKLICFNNMEDKPLEQNKQKETSVLIALKIMIKCKTM